MQLSIAKLKLKVMPTKDKIKKHLLQFTKVDIEDQAFRLKIIDSLINSIYLFNEKVIIYFNFQDSQLLSYIDAIADIDELEEGSYAKSTGFIVQY